MDELDYQKKEIEQKRKLCAEIEPVIARLTADRSSLEAERNALSIRLQQYEQESEGLRIKIAQGDVTVEVMMQLLLRRDALEALTKAGSGNLEVLDARLQTLSLSLNSARADLSRIKLMLPIEEKRISDTEAGLEWMNVS